jgi:hypothetical protein
METKRTVIVVGLGVLGLLTVALLQASQSPSVSVLQDDALVSVIGGAKNCLCRCTNSCGNLRKVNHEDHTCIYCNGTATDGYCVDMVDKNCTTSGSFSCGKKYKCENEACTIMCGDEGDCKFGTATADSDDC